MVASVAAFDPSALPSQQDLDRLRQLVVKDEAGKDVNVGELVLQGKVILICIRHFRCGYCSDFVAYLSTRVSPETLKQTNTKLVLVGCGDASAIKAYRELIQSPFPIYADPSKKVYTALGMTKRSLDAGNFVTLPEYVKGSFVGNVIGSIFNALKMGNIFGFAGDIKQLGGEFVFDQGKVVYVHRMENTRGHSNVGKILAAAGVAESSAARL